MRSSSRKTDTYTPQIYWNPWKRGFCGTHPRLRATNVSATRSSMVADPAFPPLSPRLPGKVIFPDNIIAQPSGHPAQVHSLAVEPPEPPTNDVNEKRSTPPPVSKMEPRLHPWGASRDLALRDSLYPLHRMNVKGLKTCKGQQVQIGWSAGVSILFTMLKCRYGPL